MSSPSWRRWLVGSPFATAEAAQHRLPKVLALAVFSSDALSSVAYGSQEILLQLTLAGAVGMHYTLPVSFVILMVLVLVTLSYQQTIHAYPSGGGSYIVSKDNLSVGAGLLAAAALLTDYVLTVAVSVAAGVQQITSLLPSWRPHTEAICLLAIMVITVANLRGVRESGVLFAMPTYFFIGCTFLLIGVGVVGPSLGYQPLHLNQAAPAPMEAMSVFLLLRAFASGCSALTGVEAISNGVQAFRAPESQNAAKTLLVMAVLLGVMFIGCSYLAQTHAIVYSATMSQESLLSLLARAVFHNNGFLRGALLVGTALILVLAANTAFADFPRLSAILARDGYAPRQLTRLGDRLVFSNGIVLLGAFSALLVLMFRGQTDRLIPLYAIGVFLAFTLSQAGMVRHWLRVRDTGWRWRAAANGLGCVATAVVLLVIIAEKTTQGAWIVLILIPALTWVFQGIHRYYTHLQDRGALTGTASPRVGDRIALVLVAQVNRGLLPALDYARRMGSDCSAVHVAVLPEETPQLQSLWTTWGEGIPLVILESPYRSLLGPLLDYIRKLQNDRPGCLVTIVMPEFVSSHWWEHLLHHNAALLIRWEILPLRGVVVVEVPYALEESMERQG